MSNMKNSFPNLFIRNISNNVTKDVIWNTVANLGFGIIHNVVIKKGKDNSNAVVYYEKWNMEQTGYIRRMLSSNKTLNISYDYESPPWKISQYDETMDMPVHIPRLTGEIKHRKIKMDSRCYAPKKTLPSKSSYKDLDSVCKNLFMFPEFENQK